MLGGVCVWILFLLVRASRQEAPNSGAEEERRDAVEKGVQHEQKYSNKREREQGKGNGGAKDEGEEERRRGQKKFGMKMKEGEGKGRDQQGM